MEPHTDKRRKPKMVVILGNISGGKSTSSAGVQEAITGASVVVVAEPLKRWRELGLSQAYYKDIDPKNPNQGQERRAVFFQDYAISSRLAAYKTAMKSDCDIVIGDGHILNDRHVFAKKLNMDLPIPEGSPPGTLAKKLITDQELTWYVDSYNNWRILCPKSVPDLIFYLRTTPSICLQRIQKRMKDEGRLEESVITLGYLTDLHNLYEELIKSDEVKDKVHIIDGDQEEEEVVRQIVAIINNQMLFAPDCSKWTNIIHNVPLFEAPIPAWNSTEKLALAKELMTEGVKFEGKGNGYKGAMDDSLNTDPSQSAVLANGDHKEFGMSSQWR
jgi:deoxyadenosine/deoxycytidine kinase